MSYSIDFRKHVLLVKKDEELSLKATSLRFKIAISSIMFWEKGHIPNQK